MTVNGATLTNDLFETLLADIAMNGALARTNQGRLFRSAFRAAASSGNRSGM